MRHLPYAEFSAAILLSAILRNKKIKFLWLIGALFIALSIALAFKDISDYPSYDLIQDELAIVNGKVLAIHVNSFILIKDMRLEHG